MSAPVVTEPEKGAAPPDAKRGFTVPAGAEKAFIPIFIVIVAALPLVLRLRRHADGQRDARALPTS